MSDISPPAAAIPVDENAIIAERRAKLTRLREAGPAYPNDFVPQQNAAELHATHAEHDKAQLEAQGIKVRLAGRMMLKRVMGRASFATLQDSTGRMQIYVNDEGVGADVHEAFKHWDLGDLIGVEGLMFRTNKGELSIQARVLRLLSKSLRPLPDKFHGVQDQELRYRQRYVDLLMTPRTREVFLLRSKTIAALRNHMTQAGFLEVETPMLHGIPGGAAARPFTTHHNALDMPMYLRIAPELYLKRLVVGGFERVFEINRNFRNEGLSPRHNPEFTMMEFYAAYTDYRWQMDFTEQLIRAAAIEACGTAVLEYQGRVLDLSHPFARLTIPEAIRRYVPGAAQLDLDDIATLQEILAKAGENPQQPKYRSAGVGALQLGVFEATVEPQLWEPVFIVDYPTEVSPLARASDHQPDITERFELFMTGREIANGFSELNDPEDQAERFNRQVLAKDAGDDEAMFFDADYIRALEYGMPPASGCGIGIDRLVMLLTDSPSIRDVILFPQLRREEVL